MEISSSGYDDLREIVNEMYPGRESDVAEYFNNIAYITTDNHIIPQYGVSQNFQNKDEVVEFLLDDFLEATNQQDTVLQLPRITK